VFDVVTEPLGLDALEVVVEERRQAEAEGRVRVARRRLQKKKMFDMKMKLANPPMM
jgi:hypothetical protein